MILDTLFIIFILNTNMKCNSSKLAILQLSMKQHDISIYIQL